MQALSAEDKKLIEESIHDKYSKVALNADGQFNYITGKAALDFLEYDASVLESIPDSVSKSYCGVGNPFKLGRINEGAHVLDIGSGAGLDSVVASILVGPSGKVTGVDITPGMLERARQNADEMNLENIEFVEISDDRLPFPENHFDFIISNGVLNLVTDKQKMFNEMHKVLKHNGQLMVADQVLTSDEAVCKEDLVKSWFR